jgi:hypothetical protein
MSSNTQKYFNLFFNPFAAGNIPLSSGDTTTSKALKHGAGLAIGYGTLGALAKYISHLRQQAVEAKTTEEMKNYINARNPILSLDASTRDVKKEEKLKELGAEETSDLIMKQATEAWDTLSDKTTSRFHPAVALAALLAGTYGGWKLTDSIINDNKKDELNNSISDTENTIDKLLYEEYKRTRGLNKTAAEAIHSISGYLPGNVPRTEMNSLGDYINPSNIGRASLSLYILAALGIAGLSYKSAKGYMDNKDPNRQRLKELNTIMQDITRVKGVPKFTDLSYIDEELEKDKKKKQSVVPLGRREEAKKIPAPLVDDTDPYAKLLAQG